VFKIGLSRDRLKKSNLHWIWKVLSTVHQRIFKYLQADHRDLKRELKGFSLGKRAGASIRGAEEKVDNGTNFFEILPWQQNGGRDRRQRLCARMRIVSIPRKTASPAGIPFPKIKLG